MIVRTNTRNSILSHGRQRVSCKGNEVDEVRCSKELCGVGRKGACILR